MSPSSTCRIHLPRRARVRRSGQVVRTLQFAFSGSRITPTVVAAFVVVASLVVSASAQQRATSSAFRVEETTIAAVHREMKAGRLTCRALVQSYLRRIDAYDKKGPALNAIVVTNPSVLVEADELDAR